MINLRKFVAGTLVVVSCITVGVTPATIGATTCGVQEDDPFVRLEERGFQIITSASTYSMDAFDVNKINSHLLLDQQVFSNALCNQPEKIKEAIYNGNIVAVFDSSNKDCNYEKTLGLPLGFESVRNSRRDIRKSIGYIYQADELGGVHITRVNTRLGTGSDDEEINTFAEILSNYEVKEAVSDVKTRSTLSTKYIGSVAEYYYGEGEKGDVFVTYEVATAQDIDGYDYYAVHACIEATPGHALYDSNYDADKLTTSLGATIWSSDAILYKTGPNTMSGASEYTVDIGVTGSKEGIGGSGNFSWSRTVPDVDIKKNVKSASKCEWVVDIKNKKPAADSTLTFEPGGIFRVAEDTEELSVEGKTTFTVDAWNEFPSTAASDSTLFYCSEDSVRLAR